MYNQEDILKSINIDDFLKMDIKPQEHLLAPAIPKQGVCMLYAFRGIGKTHVALGMAYAVATGSRFLKWSAPKARKVLYIDGEMPAIAMQERLARQTASCGIRPPSSDYFRIVSPQLQNINIPSLSTTEGQESINKILNGAQFVIIDNISTLCHGGRENESESWNPIQEWALSLRRRGITVLFIHHAGKNNQQRGSSKKEDIMDTVISLKRPFDYKTSQGARFEVHYEKSRGFSGDEAVPFEAWLKTENGISQWDVGKIEDKQLTQVMHLNEKGLTQRDIATQVGFSAAKVNRLINKSKN